MAQTTFAAIRAQIIAVIEALTPATHDRPEDKFRRSPDKRQPVDAWALTHGADTCFRKFDLRISGAVQDPEVFSNPIRRTQAAVITIAYPVQPALYGSEDIDDIEDVIASDAHQIRDAVFNPDNLLEGHVANIVTIEDVDRNDPRVWFQRLTLSIIYYHSQFLPVAEAAAVTGATIRDLTLDAATLTNGAQIEASASGLPRRITMEDEYTFPVMTSGNARGILFGADDASVIVSTTVNTVVKYSFAGVQSGGNLSIAAAHGIWRYDSNTLWVARNAAAQSTFSVINETAWTVGTSPMPSAQVRQVLHVPGGTADRAWINGGTTTLTEIVVSTGAASGRTITALSSVSALWASDGDGTPGLYVLDSGSRVTKYLESDLSQSTQWTITATAASGLPGTSTGTELYIDATGRPMVRHSGTPSIDRFTLAGGAQLAVAERYVYAGSETGGPGSVNSGGGSQAFPAFAFSSDGRYFAFTVPNAAADATNRDVRIKNILTQRARWEHTIAATGTLNSVIMPGHLGGQYGITTNWRAGTVQDFRRVRCYYSFDGGANRTEFTPNAPLDIAVTEAQTLTLDADMSNVGMLNGPLPYIGGDAGEGLRLILTPD